MNNGYILLLTTFLILIFSFIGFTILLNLNIEIKNVSNEINSFVDINNVEDALKEVIFRLSDSQSQYYIGETGILNPDWSIVITNSEIKKEIHKRVYSSVKFLFGDTLNKIEEIRLSYKKKDGLLYFYDEKNNVQFAGEPKEFSNRFKPVIIVDINQKKKYYEKNRRYEIVEVNNNSEIENVLYFQNTYFDSISPIVICDFDHREDIPFNTNIDFCKVFHNGNGNSYQGKQKINLEFQNIKWKDTIKEEFGFYRLDELKNDIKGKGLIYFGRDLRLNGNVNIYWKGLFYIDGSLIISPEYSGTIWICGSLSVKNDIIYMGKRNDVITILYSSENLRFLNHKKFLILNERME